MWKLFTFDVQTGAILSRLHVPAFSWQLPPVGIRRTGFERAGTAMDRGAGAHPP